MPRADNAHFLVEASKKRSHDARQRAEQAITDAEKSGQRLTVAGIAAAANVSRSWLYTQADLIAAIAQLQTRRPASTRTGGHPASDASLQRRLDTALERNRQLRKQVGDLTFRLEAAHGEIRRLKALSPPTEKPLGSC
ncbi:DUF6262 family protein [Streptosporangium canum]|uniref:DUF6262 family protein n=1 Tax=Streptosporangium canum TaxID=324952 RepID=UPI00367ED316